MVHGQEMSTIYTIGHSNQPAAEFVALLTKHKIECVVDVRSKPYCRFRHFNREPLKDRLISLGFDYMYLGGQLGGHPEDDDLYENGRVAYERVAALSRFRRGIKQVSAESETRRLVLMCTEENPVECHRHPLLATKLVERGVQVLHLRRNGSAQDATGIGEQTSLQLPLLEPVGEDLTWQSPKRIRPRTHT